MPRDSKGKFVKREEPQQPPLSDGLDNDQVTALNMERAARLVSNGVGGPVRAPRITSGPMPAFPQTQASSVTYHAPPIVADPPELNGEDYAAVLDPEIAEELRQLGLHPEQIVPPPMPNPPAEYSQNIPPAPPAPPQLPTAAVLTWGPHDTLRLTRLVGHLATRTWDVLGSSGTIVQILHAFGVTVVDLTGEPQA
jgi:hypothetical protein